MAAPTLPIVTPIGVASLGGSAVTGIPGPRRSGDITATGQRPPALSDCRRRGPGGAGSVKSRRAGALVWRGPRAGPRVGCSEAPTPRRPPAGPCLSMNPASRWRRSRMSERCQANSARISPPNAALPVTATVQKVPTSSAAVVASGSCVRGVAVSRRCGDVEPGASNYPPTLPDFRRRGPRVDRGGVGGARGDDRGAWASGVWFASAPLSFGRLAVDSEPAHRERGGLPSVGSGSTGRERGAGDGGRTRVAKARGAGLPPPLGESDSACASRQARSL